MESYIKEIIENNATMPDPKPDIERFSGLHSWYKHLPKFIKAYPLLFKGEEARNNLQPENLDKEGYYWRFVFDYHLDHFIVDIKNTEHGRKFIHLDPEIIKVMKKYPIYFSWDLSPSTTNSASVFQRDIAIQMCKEMWEEFF